MLINLYNALVVGLLFPAFNMSPHYDTPSVLLLSHSVLGRTGTTNQTIEFGERNLAHVIEPQLPLFFGSESCRKSCIFSDVFRETTSSTSGKFRDLWRRPTPVKTASDRTFG